MTVASKSQRRSLITFLRDSMDAHPMAQRNTKQIQNFGHPAGNKSTCKPGLQPPIPIPRDLVSSPVNVPGGHKCLDVGQIPED